MPLSQRGHGNAGTAFSKNASPQSLRVDAIIVSRLEGPIRRGHLADRSNVVIWYQRSAERDVENGVALHEWDGVLVLLAGLGADDFVGVHDKAALLAFANMGLVVERLFFKVIQMGAA